MLTDAFRFVFFLFRFFNLLIISTALPILSDLLSLFISYLEFDWYLPNPNNSTFSTFSLFLIAIKFRSVFICLLFPDIILFRAIEVDRELISSEGITYRSDSDSNTRPSSASRAKANQLSTSSALLRGKEESPGRDGNRNYLEGGSRSCTTDARGVTDLGTKIGTEQEHHQGRKERIRGSLRGRLEGGQSVMGSTGEASNVRFYLDTAYRALSVDPRLRSSMNQLRSSLDVDRSSTQSHHSARSSSEGKARNDHRINDSNPIRQVRCRGSSALSTADFRARNNKAFATASGFSSSHSAPASPSRSRDITSHRNPRSSYSHSSQTGRYERPSSIAKHSDGPDSLMKQATATALSAERGGAAGGESARRFIPGGNTEGKEFNVVARSSKVSRAATHHNAAVAARYCRQWEKRSH